MRSGLKVAVTHDVDRSYKSYHYFSKIGKSLLKRDVSTFNNQVGTLFSKENTYWNFEDILEIEAKFNIKATYFFLNESLPFNLFNPKNWVLSMGRYNIESDKLINIIGKISSCEHEIGVHGSFHSYKSEDLLLKEKEVLENILGKKIYGIRQHHLNLNNETWQLQHKAGFKYDSSLGFNNNIGYHEGRVKPFNPLSNEFKVFPLALMDFCFSKHPDKWKKLDEIIETTYLNNGILVLNWHTDTFHPKEFPNHRKDFIEIIKILISNDAKFHTLGEFYSEFYST